jgi:hypothetical protein
MLLKNNLNQAPKLTLSPLDQARPRPFFQQRHSVYTLSLFLLFTLLPTLAHAVCPTSGAANCLCAQRPGPDLTAVTSGSWNDPATWGGRLPAAGDEVTIPVGISVQASSVTTPSLASLLVTGRLEFTGTEETVSAVTARWIMVMGINAELRAGTEAAPYAGKLTFTLTGLPSEEDIAGMGTKVLAAMTGGKIALHGASKAKRSWTQLNANAAVGDTSITVAHPTGWAVGDELVVAPAGFYPYDIDRVRVTQINGQQITFTPALKQAKWGTLQYYAGRTLDQRTEVGLLTRNIVVRGDDLSQTGVHLAILNQADYAPRGGQPRLRPAYATGFGAHCMIMDNGSAQMEGVAFERCGQTGRRGRYPMHWHLLGDRPQDYIRDCSVVDSFQRGVAVHQTNLVRVERNVSFNVLSHNFFTENGNETGNTFSGNLAVLTITADPSHFAFFDDTVPHSSSRQSENRAGAFWITNVANRIVGNHVAGVHDGIGFFYDNESASNLGPESDARVLENHSNTAHAIFRNATFGNDRYGPQGTGFGIMFRGLFYHGFNSYGATTLVDDESTWGDIVLRGYTLYHCSNGGAWLEEGHVLADSVLADNKFSVHPSTSLIARCSIIGRSNNPIEGTHELGRPWPRSGGINVSDKLFIGAGPQLRDIDFFRCEPAAIFMDMFSSLPTLSTAGLTFTNTPRLFLERENVMLLDLDGSLTGLGPWTYAGGPGIIPRSLDSVPFASGRAQGHLQLPHWLQIHTLDQVPIQSASVQRSDGALGTLDRPANTGNTKTREGWLAGGYEFNITLQPTTQRQRLGFEFAAGERGKPAIISLPLNMSDRPLLFCARPGTGTLFPDYSQPIPRASDLNALKASTRDAWWFDDVQKVLHLNRHSGEQRWVAMSANTVLSTPALAWLITQFGEDAVFSSNGETRYNASLNGDPDGDGINNAFEFARGTNPLVMDTNPLLQHIPTTGAIVGRWYDGQAASARLSLQIHNPSTNQWVSADGSPVVISSGPPRLMEARSAFRRGQTQKRMRLELKLTHAEGDYFTTYSEVRGLNLNGSVFVE